MDGNHKTQVEELFRQRWTIIVLHCLYADGPMRWTDVRHAMSRQTGSPIGDQTVTRPLKTLQRLGLVARDGQQGDRLYTLTPLGAERVHQLQELFTRLDQHRKDEGRGTD